MNKKNKQLVVTISKTNIDKLDVCDDYQLCCDDRIHIKFKNYVKEEIISGFHNKLVWVLTTMINSYNYTIPDLNDVWNQYLTEFTSSENDEYTKLKELMRKHFKDFKGFTFQKSYNYKNEFQQFGTSTFKCESGQVGGHINTLFHCSLETILFDDSIEIRLESKDVLKSRIDKSYLKFDNKKIRHTKKQESKNSFCTLDLWS